MEKWLIRILCVFALTAGVALYLQSNRVGDLQSQVTKLNHACIPTNTGGGVTQCLQASVEDQKTKREFKAVNTELNLHDEWLFDLGCRMTNRAQAYCRKAGSIGTALYAYRDNNGHLHYYTN
jgi:hypothetical protein